MRLDEVITYIWDNAIELQFGKRKNWDMDTFKRSWYMKKYNSIWKKGGSSGMYWFLIKDQSLQDFQNIETPKNLPAKAINIHKIVNKNLDVFKEENICKPDQSGFSVFYNGHEKNVFARIRSHFALNNERTGAIGVSKYDLSNVDIRVRFFHSELPMTQLNIEEKSFIKNLLINKRGREALESYWRAIYGWPILCSR